MQAIKMMSTETIGLTMHTKTYDKPPKKKDKGTSSKKKPSINHSSSLPLSTIPITIEKPICDAILRAPKTLIHKLVCNPSG